MNTSYDTLTITINADSKQANTSIKALYTNLRNLEDTAKNLDDKRIGEVKKLLQGIAKIDFSNVSKGLQDVVNAFKAFQSKSFQKAMSGEGLTGSLKDQEKSYTPNWEMKSWAYSNDTSLTVIKEMRGEVEALNGDLTSNAKTWQETIEGLDKQLPSVILSFREMKEETIDLEDVLKGEGFNGDQIRKVMSAIHQELKNISPEQLKKLRDILIQFGASAEQADNIVKSLAKDANKLDSGAKKGANGFKKLANQFKNIMKYRIIRKIIQEIYKALTEGVKNVIAFDKATSDTVNELKSKFEFVKNSLGAMLAPLIQMVAPILNTIMTMVGELGNTFAEIFAGANGQTQFAKATDDLRDFNEEAKKTQTLGIDELNVFQQDSPSGFTMEQVQLGEKTEGIAGAIKNIFAKIKEIIDKIKPVIQDLTNKLLPAIGNLLTPIMQIISNIVDLVMTLVGQTFGDVNSSLADFINMLGSILGFVSSIISMVKTILMPVVHILSAVLNSINSVLGGAFKFIGAIFEILKPILNIVNVLLVPVSALLTVVSTIFYVIQGIVQTIVKIVTFDWANIGNTWVEVGSNIKKAWEDMGKVANDAVNGVAGYATGGFPEDGFFYANHNELVGKFTNGKTAVANNEQITQGIYEAVRDAMREGGSQGGISIQIDGQELAKVITKKQNNFGADLIVGGNLAYGK